MHIAQKEFTIAAPQARVWELLGRIIYRSLPLEQMEVVSETTFFAVLRWRIAFIRLPLRVKVALVHLPAPRPERLVYVLCVSAQPVADTRL